MEATFGAELTPMHPNQIRQLRIAAVKAHKLHMMGVSHQVSLLAMPVDRDPDWQISIRILQGFAREAWNREHHPHPDHLTLHEFGLLFGLPAPPAYSGYATAWKDPVANIHYTLRKLDLTWVHPTVWEFRGQQLDLRAGTPALLARLLRPAHRIRQLRQAGFPGAPEDWQPDYLFHVLDSSGSKRSLTIHATKSSAVIHV
jgi:hypothetical protein